MWLYWCLLSTVIGGFTAIAVKKCSENETKRIVLMGLLSYHFIIFILSVIVHPEFITKLNIVDIIYLSPGILLQSIGFYCIISATKYGRVAITSSISKAKVVVTFLLGILILKERCTLLQLFIFIILIILSIMVAENKAETNSKIDKKLEQKAILYSYGFVFFNGASSFLNKVYVTTYQDPMYVVFNHAIIIILGLFIYCLVTKNWNYMDIRKINAKKFFYIAIFIRCIFFYI